MRKFAISDIHGCRQTFAKLLKTIDLQKTDELYLLGDYIDRGPDSKGVIDFIWELQTTGYTVRCLRGNHEQMLLNSCKPANQWADAGDPALLASFGVGRVQNIPQNYKEWMNRLPYYFEVDHFLLTHAGLNFNQPDPMKDLESMLWIRNWRADVDRRWLNGRIVVHGHTPAKRSVIEHFHQYATATPAVDIDNGCVYTTYEEMGALCAFNLTENELTFEEYCG